MNFKGKRNKQKQSFVSDRSSDIIGSNVIKISGVDNRFRNNPKYTIKIKLNKIVIIFKSTSFIDFIHFITTKINPPKLHGVGNTIFEKNHLKPLSVGKCRCLAKSLTTNVLRSPHAAWRRFKLTTDWVGCFVFSKHFVWNFFNKKAYTKVTYSDLNWGPFIEQFYCESERFKQPLRVNTFWRFSKHFKVRSMQLTNCDWL